MQTLQIQMEMNTKFQQKMFEAHLAHVEYITYHSQRKSNHDVINETVSTK